MNSDRLSPAEIKIKTENVNIEITIPPFVIQNNMNIVREITNEMWDNVREYEAAMYNSKK